ncbi:DNA-packaging protein [Erwinia tracheiphila]|uniref:DNA-packaging protein n=1 Tax=Erwinia tracheiphila TaxID=65700 RepID=A0A0M2KIJ7_9GAMM|nr:DNA-packaging protein [Erwinia tracheiphila]KKF37058.1 DNA-packaging protein [Erwinia tracheiphila]UIA88420.1 DNA-packaging protein [Erwinia tracheiphila]UIA96794.1 DNA-packaging protein [Erwinia tracheiphila]
MAPPKGNRFWEARSSHGRKPVFESPEALWAASVEYFEWVEKHPLKEQKIFCFQGAVTRATVNKMRAMTVKGLCLFLDISHTTWNNYCAKQEFEEITTQISNVIYDQKFSGAAADLLNASIIARDLGLKDQQQIEDVTPDKGDRDKRRSRIQELLSRAKRN